MGNPSHTVPHYKAWYGSARWQRVRTLHRRTHPLCEMCKPRIVEAQVVDHVEPHRGDPEKFWDQANLQSLCLTHHNSDKQRLERGSKPKPVIGNDGWPEDAGGGVQKT